jgi:Na+/H+ antiporter NhaD/arsenite permease-like protein
VTGLPDRALAGLAASGLDAEGLAVLAPLTLLGANTIGNVPLVVLLLAVFPTLSEGAYYALAVLSTLAGNLLVVGSLANIIAVERARDAGVRLSFAEHAKCGVPMTLLSLLLALAWLYGAGYAAP